MREFKCRFCHVDLESYRGEDVVCDCGAMYNGFGQQVTGPLSGIDESYAGERWEDD